MPERIKNLKKIINLKEIKKIKNIDRKKAVNIAVELVTTAVTVWFFIIYLKNTCRPLVQLARYSHATVDDFYIANGTRVVWKETHSIFKCIIAAFEYAVYLWRAWDGCFLSMFLTALCPVAISEYYYRFCFYIIAAGVVTGISIFYAALLRVCFKMRLRNVIWYILIAIPLFLNFVNSMGEGYYWWSGGINYTFFMGVTMMASGLALVYAADRKIVWIILCSILSFCVGLGNPLTALVSPLIFLYIMGLCMLNRRQYKSYLLLIIPFVTGVIGLLLSILAPGNLVRNGSGLFDKPIFMTIVNTIRYSSFLLKGTLKVPIIMIVIIAYIVAFVGFRSSKCTFEFRMPLLFLVLSYLAVCASFTPMIYSEMGFLPRTVVLLYLMAYWMYMTSAVYLAGWTNRMYEKHFAKRVEGFIESKNGAVRLMAAKCGVIATMLLVVGLNVTYWSNKADYSAYRAKLDMAAGYPQRFNDIVIGYYLQLDDPTVDVVNVRDIPGIPYHFWYPCADNYKAQADFYRTYIEYTPGFE